MVRDQVEIATALELLHEYVDTVVNMSFPYWPFTAMGNLRIQVSICYLSESIQAMELVVDIENGHISVIAKSPIFII